MKHVALFFFCGLLIIWFSVDHEQNPAPPQPPQLRAEAPKQIFKDKYTESDAEFAAQLVRDRMTCNETIHMRTWNDDGGGWFLHCVSMDVHHYYVIKAVPGA